MELIPEVGYSPTQAARLLGVSTKTLYRAMDSGLLPYGEHKRKAGRFILGRNIIKYSTK